MGRSLVIVESPAKAKTINKYLGRQFVVKSSVGHIRDLPTSGSGQAAKKAGGAKKGQKATPEEKARKAQAALVRRMGVDPEHEWEAHYEVLPGKEKVLDELQKLAANADQIYLATDLDREGEAIAWHLREAIGGDESRYKRVVFAEITRTAIERAFEQPGSLNMDRVNAQQARRFLDRVVGFMLSPLLWKKVARGLSAGRVQSVATRLVVEREREIRAFIPEEYWECRAQLAAQAGEVLAQVMKLRGEKFLPHSKDEMDASLAQLKEATYTVANREDKPTRSRPSAPFITSTLQQAASTRLGYGVKRTMTCAQRLYEAGHITYMRTDSTNLSSEAVQACRGYIGKHYGDRYLPEKPNNYASKEGAQEAHEAIRPADVRNPPSDLKDVDEDQRRLYDLIWRQFIACQMPPAEFDTTAITITAGEHELRARGRVLRFDGYLAVMPQGGKRKEDDHELPDVRVGETLDLRELQPTQHYTKPPARFSEASLVKELEKRGIGRPSTYAAIIGTIQDRGYVRVESRRFYAEKMGEIVTDRLTENFGDLLDYGFTAQMEEQLDTIAQGDEQWRAVLDRFYKHFVDELDRADEAMRGNQPVETPIDCPECGRKMLVRTGKTGVFLSCSGYQLPPKERCTKTMNLIPGEEAIAADPDDENAEVDALRRLRRCDVCGTAMDSYLIDEDRKLHVCGNNPDCPGVEIEHGSFKIKGYEGPTIECDKCGKPMELKSGRFGKYFGCTGYPECKNTRKLLRSGEPAPPKADPVPMPELPCEQSDGHFILRDGAAGIFLASSNYPRSRETRPPKVEDLKRHRDELDPKHHFLADAPATDQKGNPFIIRFSRKTKEYFIQALVDDKPEGTRGDFIDGDWQLSEPKKKAAKKKSAAKKSAAKK